MPDFSVRSQGIEIMDDLNCSGEVVRQTLRELEFINAWLGGNAITLDGLNKLCLGIDRSRELVIADLGCGGGDMLRHIDAWATRHGYRVRLIGIDANPFIIAVAKNNQRDLPHIEFYAQDIFSEEFKRQQFDIVIGTLFYHHFDSERLSAFFRQLATQVRVGLLVNDLHRHALAYHSIKLLTALFSRSAMVKFDAPLSVLRGFRKDELQTVLRTAGLENAAVRWKWAFRWQVVCRFLTSSSLAR